MTAARGLQPRPALSPHSSTGPRAARISSRGLPVRPQPRLPTIPSILTIRASARMDSGPHVIQMGAAPGPTIPTDAFPRDIMTCANRTHSERIMGCKLRPTGNACITD